MSSKQLYSSNSKSKSGRMASKDSKKPEPYHSKPIYTWFHPVKSAAKPEEGEAETSEASLPTVLPSWNEATSDATSNPTDDNGTQGLRSINEVLKSWKPPKVKEVENDEDDQEEDAPQRVPRFERVFDVLMKGREWQETKSSALEQILNEAAADPLVIEACKSEFPAPQADISVKAAKVILLNVALVQHRNKLKSINQMPSKSRISADFYPSMASSSFKKIYNVMKAQGYIDRASEAAKATLAPKKRVVENFQDHLIDPQ